MINYNYHTMSDDKQPETESSGEMTTDTVVFYHNGDGNDLCETCHSTREE